MLFIIFVAYLQPDGEGNKIVKYSDDASSLFPENTDVQIYDEFDKVAAWASENKLRSKMVKSSK